MLVNLDVLIGLAVVMLGLSLIVTMVGHVASNTLAVRETNLRWGLSTLVQQLHADRFVPPKPGMPLFDRDLNERASALVTKVLSHPLLSDSKFPFGRWKMASAVRFDELMKIVALESMSIRDSDLLWLSANNRITEPWFNSMMDRVSQRFTLHMRIYTIVISFVLVGLLRVDTLYVLSTLRSDAALRSGLVTAAESVAKPDSGADASDAAKAKVVANSVISNLPADQSVLGLLHRAGHNDEILRGASPTGLLLSMMLLSLGAPFWFNVLKNLTALRPVLAQKTEKERAERTTVPDVGDRISWKDL
jgi:hypothetical protein